MIKDDPIHRFNRWARRIQAIAQNGLTYTEGAYDRERYEELTEIAVEMLAAATSATPEEVRGQLHLEAGYVTPKVDVRGVVFSEQGVNVSGQYLQTRGDIGYVVIDVDTASSEAALAALHAVPGTIRSRLLF